MATLQIRVESATLLYDKKHLRQTLRTAGSEVAAAARKLIRSSPAVGAVYRGKYRGRQASAPGSAPRSLSGLLARSVKLKAIAKGDGISIRDVAWYALALEVGAARYPAGFKRIHRTRTAAPHGMRMQPRPYLSVALDQRAPTLLPRIQQALRDDIKLVKQKP